MASFVSSIFLGTESEHNIAGIKIIFGDKPQKVLNQEPEEKNTVSAIAHECFKKAFSFVTFKPMHSFINGMGYLLANKMAGGRITQLRILNTQVGASFLPDNIWGQEDLERTQRIEKIAVTIHLAFESFLITGAQALAGYITKPVPVVLAGSAIFWIADRVLKQTNMKFRLDSVAYGWKGNAVLVATYALSLFAAYKMI